jgi:hypothetical protein
MEKTIVTTESLNLFLNGIIDYAGLFPPANLTLHNSYSNYLKYMESPHSRMLAKFIIPAGKLSDLAEIYERFDVNNKVPLSVLFNEAETEDAFNINLKNDIKAIKEFREKIADKAAAEAFELKVPADIKDDEEKLKRFLVNINSNIEKKLKLDVPVFFESPADAVMPVVIEAISSFNKETKTRYGFKLRTGGVKKSYFPDAGVIATAIKIAQNHELPIKFTAGLHHPFRHFNEGVQTYMHGFINMFAASVLNCSHNINRHEIKEILLDENPDNFEFHDTFFKWKNLVVLNSLIEDARKDYIISFGSCSFEEPIDDLKVLELI